LLMLGTWGYENPYCANRCIVVSLSSDKYTYTYCKLLLIKTSAKFPTCNEDVDITEYSFQHMPL
jgi:proteasome lid subunit RPN8/RPN11